MSVASSVDVESTTFLERLVVRRRTELELGWRGLRTDLETHAEALARFRDWLKNLEPCCARNVDLGRILVR